MFAKILAALVSAFQRKTGGETGHAEPEVFIDGEGWLQGPNVVHYPSVRSSSLHTSEPAGIVWHYTATKWGTAKSLAKRIRAYRKGKDRAASWHVLVANDGAIYQSVPFLRGAWHCAKGIVNGVSVNRGTVGIELEGYGKRFPLAQLESAEAITRALVETYGMSKVNAGLDHSQFDPKRRSDPGPVFAHHRREFLSRIFPVAE